MIKVELEKNKNVLPNIDTTERRCFCLSTLNVAVVFSFTCGCHNPAALIKVFKFLAWKTNKQTNDSIIINDKQIMSFCYITLLLNSASKFLALPHSATCLNPSDAICPSPQNEKFVLCVAPMTSEKCVSHKLVGKSFGWVELDQRPSKTICIT